VKCPGLIRGALAGLLLLAGPAPSFGADPQPEAGYSFSGGDGSSPEKAVIVHARSESVGIRAEYEWIRQHWPGSRRGKQALLGKNNRFYDSLTITDSAGQERTVYFDITEYFGKL
jgi:hypothetical protein